MTGLPVLGYNLWWSVGGAEIQQNELVALLAQYGFAHYSPDPPTEIKSLRRAIAAWLKARGGLGSVPCQSAGTVPEERAENSSPMPVRKNARRDLVRPINNRALRHAVFALVAEDIDFAALGLRYGTRVRILLEKLTPAQRAVREPALVVTTEAQGIVQADNEARWLTNELSIYWQHYRGIHRGDDLGRLMTEIVLAMPTAIRVKDRGGLYFVTVHDEQRVLAFKHLIEALPAVHDQNWCVMLPVIDETASRRELTSAIHRGFMADIQALHCSLTDLRAKSRQVGAETVASRLASYRAVQQRAQVYADLLGMQREAIEQGLEDVRTQAQALLLDATDLDQAA